MNKLSKLLCGLAFLGMAAGCSDDVPSGGSQADGKSGDVYARLTLSLPTSRSVTTGPNGESDAGFEIGKDYENSVTSVLVVLASKEGENYKYVASALTDTKGQTPVNGEVDENAPKKPMYTLSFESEEIAEFAEKEVNVFAFCNPSMTLVDQVNELRTSGKPLNSLEGSITEDGKELCTNDYFLMSNHTLASVKVPTIQKLLMEYNTPENPFFLGTVDVARVTARFDFRETYYVDEDGTEDEVANRYPIYDNYTIVKDEDGESITESGRTLLGYVVLDAMALMNEAKNYYCLPRVSANGMDANAVLCGGETSSNFVVSPNANDKIQVPLKVEFMRNNYFYNGIASDALDGSKVAYSYDTFNFDTFATIGLDDDNNETWNPEGKPGDYKIWRYVTENTIPGNDLDGITSTIKYQRLGVTTCIVFRGYIEAADETLEAMMDGVKYLYCYNGQLIGDLDALTTKVKEMPVSSLADAFYAAAKANGYEMSTDGTIDPDKVTMDLNKTATTERGEGLKIFEPDGGKYYCYYIYRNRHNDNDRTDLMGPMEFAVVRNNVYKIDVSTINDFGHTKNPDKDPDPEDPETPDEPNKAYFRLQVRVLPWVVRINHAVL